jgi:hypothetical protein
MMNLPLDTLQFSAVTLLMTISIYLLFLNLGQERLKDLHVVPVSAGISIPSPMGNRWHKSQHAVDSFESGIGKPKVSRYCQVVCVRVGQSR